MDKLPTFTSLSLCFIVRAFNDLTFTTSIITVALTVTSSIAS